MMKKVEFNHLTLPSDFKIACFIFKITAQQALQTFIDHITIFDGFYPLYDEGFTEASEIISIYAYSKNKKFKPSPAFNNCKTLSLSVLLDVLDYSATNSHQTSAIREHAVERIKDLYDVMERKYTLQETLLLDKEKPIQLSSDFCVFCELHQCYPVEILNYFMNNISLPKTVALSGLKRVKRNICFDAFRFITANLTKDYNQTTEFSATENAFHQEITALNLKFKHTVGLKKRTAILSKSYKTHYLMMNCRVIVK